MKYPIAKVTIRNQLPGGWHQIGSVLQPHFMVSRLAFWKLLGRLIRIENRIQFRCISISPEHAFTQEAEPITSNSLGSVLNKGYERQAAGWDAGKKTANIRDVQSGLDCEQFVQTFWNSDSNGYDGP